MRGAESGERRTGASHFVRLVSLLSFRRAHFLSSWAGSAPKQLVRHVHLNHRRITEPAELRPEKTLCSCNRTRTRTLTSTVNPSSCLRANPVHGHLPFPVRRRGPPPGSSTFHLLKTRQSSIIHLILCSILLQCIDNDATSHPYRPYRRHRRQTISRSLHLPIHSHRLGLVITFVISPAILFGFHPVNVAVAVLLPTLSARINSTPSPADTVSRLQLALAVYGGPGTAERDH